MHHLRTRFKDILESIFRIRQAVDLVWQAGPVWVIGNLGLQIVQGLLPILSLYMMKLLVDSVSAALAMPAESRSFEPVLQVLLITAAIALVSSVIAQISDLFTKIQGMTVTDYMNDRLQEKGINLDLEFYENSDYQDTLHRAQREATYRPLYILNGLVNIAQNTISLLGVGYLLLTFNWVVIPLLLVAVLPGVVERLVNSNILYKLDRQTTQKERRSWYYHYILIAVDFAKEVRIFGLGNVLRERYQALRKEIRQLRVRAEVRHSVWNTVAQVISVVVIYAMFAMIASRTLQGDLTLGDLVMYFQAFQRGEGFLRGLLHGLARLYENNLFLNNLYEFLTLEKRVKDPAQPRPVPNPIRKAIEFKNVSFHYPNNPRPVLNDINLTVKAGEVIALVGENGSGKTTLVKLISRLYDPNSGSIQIDGADLRDFSSTDLRQQISIVFQDFARYNLSASDNIWLGGVHQPEDMTKIASAARLADIHEVLSGLRKGYDTILGTQFENGQELSIGQWQKMAIARAFFRGSQLLILDEPTSALDPKAEYELFLKFRELLNGRTAILISHRMSTVRMADRIYVMHDGCIVESGTHEELVAHHGTYAGFFERQAQNYR